MTHPPVTLVETLFSDTRVAHGFFGRRGGVSTGVYDSLNAGAGSNDAPRAVAENRARIAAAVGAPDAEALLSCYQVHGADVVHARAPWIERPEGDAMVTDLPGLALCILTADCAPVLLADEGAGVIGAAHAGWRGAASGVCEAAIEAMEAIGADRSRIHAVVGPCIHQASYEVGPDLRDAVLTASDWAGGHFAPGAGDRLHFNVPHYVVDRLERAGVRAATALSHDTCAMEADYFSNRRRNQRGEPDYGRNASVIMLRS